MTPLVSVVVTAYNYARYLPEALESALAQDHRDLEIVVVDDGSTDETPDVLGGFGDAVRVIRQPNAGLNAATARGIQAASGEFVALLDADDAWRPDKLSRQLESFAGRPEVGLVFSDMAVVDGDGRDLAPSYFARHGMRPPRGRVLGPLLAGNFVPAPTIMFRSSLAGLVLPVAGAASFQDWWIGLRIAEAAELDWVDAPLTRYRVHGENMAGGADTSPAGLERWLRNVRSDNRFRRWQLAELDLSTAAPAELVAACATLESHAVLVAQRAGVPAEQELADPPADFRRLAAELARLQAALDESRLGDALVHAVRAFAADPLSGPPRTALQELPGIIERAATPARTGASADALIRQAAERFSGGDPDVAVELLLEAAGTPDAGAGARAHAELARIALEFGDAGAGRQAACASLERRPGDAGTLTLLGRAEEAGGDLARAAFAFGAAGSRADRERVDRRRGRTAATAPAPEPEQLPAGRALIAVDFFHPSVGGSERLAESLGVALLDRGWDVGIATRALAHRTVHERRGLRIHEVAEHPAAELEAIVEGGAYEAVIALSDPRAWPVPAALQLPPGVRVVAVPCVNVENEAWLRGTPGLLERYGALLGRAEVIARSSHAGRDAAVLADLGIEGVYLPNASDVVVPEGSLRGELGIGGDVPLLLAVGNFFPEKGHAGLLRALAGHPGGWHLAIAGSPSGGAPQVAEEVAALAGADSRVTLLGGRPPAFVAGAMRDAACLLLPSLAEATPLVLLEAMSAALPWIATPACGAAHDHAGGLILPVEDFGAGIDALLGDAAAHERLGRAGRAHWEACYRWEIVADRYAALAAGASDLPPLGSPAGPLADTDAIRADVFGRVLGHLLTPAPA